MGPSLFCQQPCIMVTFHLDAFEAEPFNLHDSAVIETLMSELPKMGIHLDTPTDEVSIPLAISLIRSLSEQALKQLDVAYEQPVTTLDPASKKLFIAFPEKGRLLTSNVLTATIQFVLGLYHQQINATPKSPPDLFARLNQFLLSSTALCKSRPTQSMQDSLRSENKPWLALDFDHEDRNLFQVGFGRQQKVLRGAVSFESSHLGVLIANSKMKTLQFLSQMGFSVPQQAAVISEDQACRVANRIGYPVVLKSEFGTQGNRVYADLRSPAEVKEAFNTLNNASKINNDTAILVERYISGSVFRIEVVKGEFFDAYEMIPAGVIGDGLHCVAELVAIENKMPGRKPESDATASHVILELGPAELLMLSKQNKSENSIPKKGERVRLCSTSNWSKGGTFKRATHRVHQDNQRLVERIASALKIDLLGIDVISHDIEKSFLGEDVKTIEVNHAPNMGSYYDIEEDRFIDISKRIIQKILPDASYGDVPIILFKSTELACESEALLSDALNANGYSAGLTNQNGLVVNGQAWANPDQVDHRNPGLQLLRNDTVGAVIVDQSLEKLVDYGIGHGGCDIAVILNCGNQAIMTPVWSQGVSSKRLDMHLALSARLACIVFVEAAEGIEFCQQEKAGEIIALFTSNVEGEEKLTKLGVNSIKLLKQTDEGMLLRISYNNNCYEKWLGTGKVKEPLPWLALLASYLALDIDIDNITEIQSNNSQLIV